MKKNVKFIVLLCANIAFLISCYFSLVLNDGDWRIELVLQCAFTLSSVAIYYFIDLVEAVKKMVNPKEASNSPFLDPEKKENE